MKIFINFHPPEHKWIHADYMYNSIREPLTPKAVLSSAAKAQNIRQAKEESAIELVRRTTSCLGNAGLKVQS